jgi:hypothetical protein
MKKIKCLNCKLEKQNTKCRYESKIYYSGICPQYISKNNLTIFDEIAKFKQPKLIQ